MAYWLLFCSAFRAEFGSGGNSGSAACAEASACLFCSAFGTEFSVAFSATFRAFHHRFGCRSGCATLGAELTRDESAALGAGNALGLLGLTATLLVRVVGGLTALAVPSILHRAACHAA